jgi:DNA-binding protein YbaB
MAFDPLPAPSSLAGAVLTIENQLSALDAKLATLTFTAQSADTNITIVVDASIEIVSISIAQALLTGPSAPSLTTLASSIVTVVNQALAAAHTRAASEAATAAAAFNLQGICVPNGAFPNFAGFAEAAGALTAEEPTIDARIAALQFSGQVGVASAIATGHLDVLSLSIARVPDFLPALGADVGGAINKALRSAKLTVDSTVAGVVDTLNTNAVKMTDLCLYARDTIAFNDRSKLVGQQAGTFAAMANAGNGTTTIGNDAQVGNVWSRAPVTLRDRTHVNGFIKSNQSVTQGASDVITGTVSQQTFIQLPNFGFSVTFPGTNSGSVNLQPNTTRTLSPGSYADLIVNAGATLFLSTGTYFFTSFDIESGATISCSSGSGQVVVYVSGNVIFRGKIIEKTGGRPKFFLGAFTTNTIAVGGPFTGTIAAPNTQITLNTVGTPGHSGAFFGKAIQVDPDVTITWFPFSGTPSLGTF